MDWFSIHEMASFLGFFLGPYFPKYCSILLTFWPEIASNKTNSVFEKSFKILNFSLNRRYPNFTVYFHFGAQFTTGKPKILLKNQTFCKNYILRIIKQRKSQVQEKSQNSCKIKRKKNYLGPNWPPVTVPKAYQKFWHSL